MGEKPHPDYDLADWVLSKLTDTEKKAVSARWDDVRGAVEMILDGEFTAAQGKYNG